MSLISSQAEQQTAGKPNAPALRKLALAVGTAVLLALSTYCLPLPGVQRLRPWVPGEGVPVVRLFGESAVEPLPGFAEAAAFAELEAMSGGKLGKSRLTKSLGAAVAASLAETMEQPGQSSAAPAQPSTAPPQPEKAPVLPGEAPAQTSTAPEQPGKAPAVEQVAAADQGRKAPAAGVSPEEIAGLAQAIEDPGGRALGRFYEALLRTARRQSGAITRVAHYGDSAVAADVITHTVRRSLQQRFGDAGHGFILIARGGMHYLHRGVRHRVGANWHAFSTVRRPLGRAWYGYGGVQFRGVPGSRACFSTMDKGPVGRSVSRFELYYQRYRRGGLVSLTVDGKSTKTIDTRSAEKQDAWEVLNVPDGPHSLTVQAKGRGKVRLYGVVLERDVPGVVYDSLGLVGARADRLLNADAEHMKRQLQRRSPHLVVLAFGGNEAGNRWMKLDKYERDLTRVVRHMRGGDARIPCLLFAPLDQGERNQRGRVQTIAMVPEIVDAQRRVARAQQCAFFDAFSAMGGEGSIWQWYRSRPRLATSDFRHATPKGYEVIGNLFYKALLKGFSDYVRSGRGRR